MAELGIDRLAGFTAAEVVVAAGSICQDNPVYWRGLVKTFAAEGVLVPLPTERHGTGNPRRYSSIEVGIATVLFRLAGVMEHSRLASIAQRLRAEPLADELTIAFDDKISLTIRRGLP